MPDLAIQIQNFKSCAVRPTFFTPWVRFKKNSFCLWKKLAFFQKLFVIQLVEGRGLTSHSLLIGDTLRGLLLSSRSRMQFKIALSLCARFDRAVSFSPLFNLKCLPSPNYLPALIEFQDLFPKHSLMHNELTLPIREPFPF